MLRAKESFQWAKDSFEGLMCVGFLLCKDSCKSQIDGEKIKSMYLTTDDEEDLSITEEIITIYNKLKFMKLDKYNDDSDPVTDAKVHRLKLSKTKMQSARDLCKRSVFYFALKPSKARIFAHFCCIS